jgi:hypothetical protein
MTHKSDKSAMPQGTTNSSLSASMIRTQGLKANRYFQPLCLGFILLAMGLLACACLDIYYRGFLNAVPLFLLIFFCCIASVQIVTGAFDERMRLMSPMSMLSTVVVAIAICLPTAIIYFFVNVKAFVSASLPPLLIIIIYSSHVETIAASGRNQVGVLSSFSFEAVPVPSRGRSLNTRAVNQPRRMTEPDRSDNKAGEFPWDTLHAALFGFAVILGLGGIFLCFAGGMYISVAIAGVIAAAYQAAGWHHGCGSGTVAARAKILISGLVITVALSGAQFGLPLALAGINPNFDKPAVFAQARVDTFNTRGGCQAVIESAAKQGGAGAFVTVTVSKVFKMKWGFSAFVCVMIPEHPILFYHTKGKRR